LSVQSVFNTAGDIAKKSWQRLWDNEHRRRYTYNLIPVVDTKVLFPVDGDIGISYCRLLLHNSMLKDDSTDPESLQPLYVTAPPIEKL